MDWVPPFPSKYTGTTMCFKVFVYYASVLQCYKLVLCWPTCVSVRHCYNAVHYICVSVHQCYKVVLYMCVPLRQCYKVVLYICVSVRQCYSPHAVGALRLYIKDSFQWTLLSQPGHPQWQRSGTYADLLQYLHN